MDQGPPEIVIVAGGELVAASLVEDIDASTAYLIAADAGLDRAVELGWGEHVDMVVGDLDSVRHENLDAAAIAGVEIRPFPPDKDLTDLELALHAAVEAAPTRGKDTLVLAVDGERADHELANLLVLASPRFATLDLRWWSDRSRGWIVRGRRSLGVRSGATLTVLPVGGPAEITLEGFHWSLDHEVVEPGSTRGVSNLVLNDAPVVTVHAGAAIAITPISSPRSEGVRH